MSEAGGREADRLSIFVASRFIDAVQAELGEAFDARFAETKDPLRELAQGDGQHDAVVFSLDVPMRADSIEALPERVRALATYSVGTDHIDLEAAARRGLAVFNTPGVLSDAVAETAILLMLGAARRATESIDLIRSGRWTGWTPTQLVGTELHGKRLGILGLGDIGGRIASRARALGMEILYCNRRPLPGDHPTGAIYRSSPDALFADSDVVVLACPSTPETRGLVDAALLAAARPGMILVNIARGDLVVDADLIEALRSGRVRAAGLDVFDGEPNVDPAYLELPNVFALPHVGSSTIEARLGMGRILIEALRSWSAGGSPPNRVC
ncbi:MAG: D-glycerate dehydrogenase [Deltaproteobacteria bacterium]|jgi:glyoxylate reductase|nr:D-glycerate dehydrogenase [Deltaproteobacteria bacterium]